MDQQQRKKGGHRARRRVRRQAQRENLENTDPNLPRKPLKRNNEEVKMPTGEEILDRWIIVPAREEPSQDSRKIPRITLRRSSTERLSLGLRLSQRSQMPWRTPKPFHYDAVSGVEVKVEERVDAARWKRDAMGGCTNEKPNGIVIDHSGHKLSKVFGQKKNKEAAEPPIPTAVVLDMPVLDDDHLSVPEPKAASIGQSDRREGQEEEGRIELPAAVPVETTTSQSLELPVLDDDHLAVPEPEAASTEQTDQPDGGMKGPEGERRVEPPTIPSQAAPKLLIPEDDDDWWDLFHRGPAPNQEGDAFMQELFNKYLP